MDPCFRNKVRPVRSIQVWQYMGCLKERNKSIFVDKKMFGGRGVKVRSLLKFLAGFPYGKFLIMFMPNCQIFVASLSRQGSYCLPGFFHDFLFILYFIYIYIYKNCFALAQSVIYFLIKVNGHEDQLFKHPKPMLA